jgi:hypothetical protein
MFNRNVLKNQDPHSASLIAELGILCPSSSRSLGDQDPRIFNWTIILRRVSSDTDWHIVEWPDMTRRQTHGQHPVLDG